MTLATTNISTAAAKAAISESVNNVKGLCTSSSINEWALHKPANYGSGKNAWSTDGSNPSGYVEAVGVSSDTTGHRLGDFRGYNHDALPPRTFDGNVSFSYPKYEDYTESVPVYKGEMSETAGTSGFVVHYHDKYDLSSNALLALQLDIDGTDHGSLVDITDVNINMHIQNIFAGTYTLKCEYWTRQNILEAFIFSNNIEGGTVTLTITEAAALFTILSCSISPTTVVIPPSEPIGVNHTVTMSIRNDTATPLNRTLYWTYRKGVSLKASGSFSVSLTASETKNHYVYFNYVYPVGGEGVYTFQVHARSTSGENVAGGSTTLTAT